MYEALCDFSAIAELLVLSCWFSVLSRTSEIVTVLVGFSIHNIVRFYVIILVIDWLVMFFCLMNVFVVLFLSQNFIDAMYADC